MKKVNKTKLGAKASTKYLIKCFDKNGVLKWEDGFSNIVVTAGLNKLIDSTFVSGVVSPLWYVGLKDSAGAIVATDIMASHGGWTEGTPYSNATRPQYVPGTIAAGVVSNSGSPAVFSINASTTLYGAFLVNDNTKGGAVGTLYGGGNFTSPRAAISGDTVQVTVIITQTAV